MIDLTKLARIVGAAAALFLVYVLWRGHERAIGARDAQIKTLESANALLRTAVATDSLVLVKKDTAVVFRRVLHTDTLLQRLIDTALVHHTDTVTVTREVLVEAKAALDSTKGVADACCTLARDRGRRIAVLDSLNLDLLKRVPSPAKPWFDRAIGAGVCAGAVWLARR
ncbi:MAG TPA: hypothetical protein VF787_03355 [Thermoanaerobaculia bacterium]